MTAPSEAPASALAPGEGGPAWHTLSAGHVPHLENVAGQHGLSSAEAASRAERFGPNRFDAGKAEPRWRAFIRQYADLMQMVLLTLFNAVLGLQQEGKAAAAIAARSKPSSRPPASTSGSGSSAWPWRYPSSSCPRSARPWCDDAPYRAIR